MIACDSCDEWFHGKCVGITHRKAEKITKYICDSCRPKNTQTNNNNHNNNHNNTNNNEKNDIIKHPKCAYKECNNLAKAPSKYCSEECGIKKAKDKLLVNQMIQVKNVSQGAESADGEDIRAFDELEKKRKAILQSLIDVEEREKELEKAIKYSQNLFGPDVLSTEVC